MGGMSRSGFGPFILDRASGTLAHDGKHVPLGGRSIALLAVLLDADGAVVSKNDLMAGAWPGLAVEEGNLTVQMGTLRKALGQRADNSEWIVTVPRVGYRLWTEDAQPPREPQSPLPSLAVLPFVNLSADPSQDYFVDGIVEDLLTGLSRFKSFVVIARNSSFVYKGRAVDVRQVGRELGVRYVLEGSIRRAGTRLRVTAQLVDAATAGHLWAQHYDGALEDVFDMQDRITESVVSIVEPMIKRAEIERTRLKPPSSLDAYDLYLQALALHLATEPGATARAIDLIERSLALEPDFPPAIAVAAISYASEFDRQLPSSREESRRKGLQYARAALAIPGADANTRAVAGLASIILGQEYDSGMAAIRQAVNENPNGINLLGHSGVGAFWSGELKEAEGYFLRAVRLNPNDHAGQWILTRLAHIRLIDGRYEEALEWASRAHAVAPANAVTHCMLIAANAYLGRQEDAERWVAALGKLSPETSFTSIRRGNLVRDPHQNEVLIQGMMLAGMREVG
jgi:TolB-like protein